MLEDNEMGRQKHAIHASYGFFPKKIMSFRFVSVSRAVVQDQKVPPRRRKDRHLPIRTLVVGADDLQRPCGKQRGCFGSSPEV